MQPGTLRGRFTALSLVLFVGFLLYEFVFRDFYFTPADRQRQLVHNNGMQRGFSVALVWPPHNDKSLIEGVTLAKEELDAAAPDNPVYLTQTTGHYGVANSAALKLAGVTKDTKELRFTVRTTAESPLGKKDNLFVQVDVPLNGATTTHRVALGSSLRIDAPRKGSPAPAVPASHEPSLSIVSASRRPPPCSASCRTSAT